MRSESSHAEGSYSHAEGLYSHADGWYTYTKVPRSQQQSYTKPQEFALKKEVDDVKARFKICDDNFSIIDKRFSTVKDHIDYLDNKMQNIDARWRDLTWQFDEKINNQPKAAKSEGWRVSVHKGRNTVNIKVH